MMAGWCTLLQWFLCASMAQVTKADADDFYTHTVKDIEGKDVNLEKYRGSVSLVVNVASECGYTDSHYKQLVELQSEIAAISTKFQVLAFPCNQFGAQEPHDNKEIQKFAEGRYKVNFPMFSKIDVIGDNANTAFASLISQSGKAPTWNFWKYLVDADGKVTAAWGPEESVESIAEIVRIEVALSGNMILEPGTIEKHLHREL